LRECETDGASCQLAGSGMSSDEPSLVTVQKTMKQFRTWGTHFRVSSVTSEFRPVQWSRHVTLLTKCVTPRGIHVKVKGNMKN